MNTCTVNTCLGYNTTFWVIIYAIYDSSQIEIFKTSYQMEQNCLESEFGGILGILLMPKT